MAGIWDSNLKRLVLANPQHFVTWLLAGAQVIRELSEHLNRAIDTQEDKNWLIRRFRMYQDILRDTEIYQIIMQEGVQQQQQKELQDLRQILLGFLQERFSGLVSFATTQISNITDIEILKQLTLKVSLSQTENEARQYLVEAGKKNRN